MTLLLALEKVGEKDRNLVGGKAFSLARLSAAGFPVPRSLCITTAAYRRFIHEKGLAERFQLEWSRKNFSEMRWEEMWDTSLRIRHLFINQEWPADLEKEIAGNITAVFGNKPVALRSSAPEEDSRTASFAGLHESYIHIAGTAAILDHIKLVWASLWSDAAFLYRQELGLDIEKSSMAVLVQEVVSGRSSGILFTQSPSDAGKIVIEAVHGLNQALVDGAVEPDRWFMNREGGEVQFSPARRDRYLVPASQGTEMAALPHSLQDRPPLANKEIQLLFDTGMAIEQLYGSPQDIEWTISDATLTILQSRPVSTAGEEGQKDQRSWYLSLRRSLQNLQELRQKIEDIYLPAMEREAEELAGVDLESLADDELADEIERRLAMEHKWTALYWEEFIPFAHGMRLFGQVYNDVVRPQNAYEFMDLLTATPLESVNRNEMIQAMAELVRNNQSLREQLLTGRTTDFADDEFRQLFAAFIERYGDLSCALGLEDHCRAGQQTLIAVILETAAHERVSKRSTGRESSMLVEQYFQAFPEGKRGQAEEMLELGRASYRLRDDDNIYLGRFEQQVARSVDEACRRFEKENRIDAGLSLEAKECLQALRNPSYIPAPKKESGGKPERIEPATRARQLLGQPAGPGMAQGRALVLESIDDVSRFKKGDVLVCDAIDPNMTFVVPLAGAIVERRGGMLIHGAIIAREYGIPCVTGIPDATSLIQSGDIVNVDGYLGIVTIKKD